MNKIRIGVIFGGRSGEHEVSLHSARSVMDALDKDRYETIPIGITKDGHWVTGNSTWKALRSGAGETVDAALLGEPGQHALMAVEEDRGRMGLRDVATLDVIFPVLHGPYGEDGTVQGLLELADIPYVGAGVVGSAVGMDKTIFKSVIRAHGLPVLPYKLVLRSDWEREHQAVLDELEGLLAYPMFTKPANLGSSVGVSKVRNREELKAGLDEAAAYDRRLLVEQGIEAREIEVSVMGNDEPLASIPGEVVPADEFYSYEDKYIRGEAQLLIPAPLDEEQAALAQRLAVAAYAAIDCAGLARCDFLLDKQDGALYVSEVNTIPGFTAISMYPKLWEASGVPYPELIDRLVEYALERHAQKRRCKTSYEPPEDW
jgi:D-alanine-D-alanine ligase